MYTTFDYSNKKAIKADITQLLQLRTTPQPNGELAKLEKRLTVYQPNDIFGAHTKNASVVLEGPHYPKPHKWYAQGKTDENGILINIK